MLLVILELKQIAKKATESRKYLSLYMVKHCYTSLKIHCKLCAVKRYYFFTVLLSPSYFLPHSHKRILPPFTLPLHS